MAATAGYRAVGKRGAEAPRPSRSACCPAPLRVGERGKAESQHQPRLRFGDGRDDAGAGNGQRVLAREVVVVTGKDDGVKRSRFKFAGEAGSVVAHQVIAAGHTVELRRRRIECILVEEQHRVESQAGRDEAVLAAGVDADGDGVVGDVCTGSGQVREVGEWPIKGGAAGGIAGVGDELGLGAVDEADEERADRQRGTEELGYVHGVFLFHKGSGEACRGKATGGVSMACKFGNLGGYAWYRAALAVGCATAQRWRNIHVCNNYCK